MGENWRTAMLPNLHRYQELLDQLGRQGAAAPTLSKDERERLQGLVRTQGQQMVSAALALLSKEKTALAEVMTRSRQLLSSTPWAFCCCSWWPTPICWAPACWGPSTASASTPTASPRATSPR